MEGFCCGCRFLWWEFKNKNGLKEEEEEEEEEEEAEEEAEGNSFGGGVGVVMEQINLHWQGNL